MTNPEGMVGDGPTSEQPASATPASDPAERAPAPAPAPAPQADTATAFDLRCSTACTASGASILILCALALASFGVVKRDVQARALIEYLQRRVDLSEAMREFQADDCWAVIGGDDSWPIKKLTGLMCARIPAQARAAEPLPAAPPKANATPTPTPTPKPRPPATGATSSPTSAPVLVPPERPSRVRLVLPFETATKVRDAVAALVDHKLLTTARGFSNRAGRLIFDWENLRYDLAVRAASVGAGPSQGPVTIVAEGGEMTVDYALENLTVGEVRKLADYALPSSTEMDEMLQTRGMQVPSIGSLPVWYGVIALEAVLLIAMLHFWLFFREATLSPSFPAGATLFGVLWRTRLSLAVFAILSIAPCVAGAVLAAEARTITRVPIALCVPLLLVNLGVLKHTADTRLRRTR